MEIFSVEGRLKSIMSEAAQKFADLGLVTKIVTTYTDKNFEDYTEFNSKVNALWVELLIGTPDMAEEDMLLYCLSADFKPGGEKITSLPKESELAELQADLNEVYERLTSAQGVEEELKKISKENEEKSIEMMKELNKKVKRSFIFLGISVAVLIVCFIITHLV